MKQFKQLLPGILLILVVINFCLLGWNAARANALNHPPVKAATNTQIAGAPVNSTIAFNPASTEADLSVSRSSEGERLSQNPTPATSPRQLKFKLSEQDLLSQDFVGGSWKLAISKAFPYLKGVSVAVVNIKPGGLRLPHWHTNINELSYCVQGQARVGVGGNKNQVENFELQPGDLLYAPKGYIHYIENIGKQDLKMLFIGDNELPETIDVTEALGAIPDQVLGTSFHVPAQTFQNFPKKTEVFTKSKS